jgi:dTDP-4-dehydrorhamnose 3,5-epimerase
MDRDAIPPGTPDLVFRELRPTEIEGCFEIMSHIRSDSRGQFVKTFHAEWFESQGLRTDFVEQYYSVSHRRVLRGLHFQIPPAQHAKLVYCTDGAVLDAAVDLRPRSSTFCKHILLELCAGAANMLYLPEGVAHGFYVVTESATLIYSVTSAYAPECDSGIRWDSAGIEWPDDDPIVSERDRQLPLFSEASRIFPDVSP